MTAPTAPSSRGYGRLARRLIFLFVAVSLVPLILSDWLAMYATGDVNRTLKEKSESQRVHLVSRQVFDKLLNAKLLLGNFPASADDEAKLPGVGIVFASARFCGACEGSYEPLIVAWNSAPHAATASQQFRVREASSNLDVAIRIARDGSRSRVLMATLRNGALLWVAELDRTYLWSAVIDASESNTWSVVDASATPLFVSSSTGLTGFAPVRSRIFLGAEFDTPDWIFESDIVNPTVMWQGLPVAVWLALVAAATLLMIALFSLWRIRRTLAPLTVLTASTRLLGRGETPVRVDVQRDDEIGDLGFAFNEMSARIAAQFKTLSELAAIDRDILNGASIRTLGARAIDQLVSESPEASVHFEWLQADGTLGRIDSATSDAPAGPDRLPDFLALSERAASHGGVVSQMRDGANETDIPIVLNGQTRAAIVWRSSKIIDEKTLLSSFNLRDRLAVAFAARDRETELVHLATHDTLTGLASRYRLHQVLETVAASPDTERSSLLFIDLDHFKDINDSRGHQAGDELLCVIAERLRECCPDASVLARQGGDEFALVLIGLDQNDASVLAEKILVAVKKPVVLESGPCAVSASIGIAAFPLHARSREGLLRCADVALYAAKAGGRNAFRVFNIALDEAEQTRVQLSADIRGAASRGELVLHYQARVRPDDLKIAGAEALLRWNHPQRGLIGPDEFISLAEETGAIYEVGAWVIEAAAAQIAAWRKTRGILLRVSVNVSPRQFEAGTLVDQIRAALTRYQLPPDSLEIEVTESVMLGDTESAFAQMAQIRSSGIRIALDDFGTGYSSMAMLASLPFDAMKIDRSFVDGLSRNDRMRQVVRGIASIGLSSKLTLVAEGIETAEQAAELTALGCHELQGYLFGRPQSAELFALGWLGHR